LRERNRDQLQAGRTEADVYLMREVHVASVGVVSMPDLPELISSLPNRDVTVTYPAAHPDVYLRWLAYFREVEGAMLEHPQLAELAIRESGPFVSGPAAGFVSSSVGLLARQARDAQAEGLPQVAPVISANARLLAEALRLVERRNAWLEAQINGRPLVEVLGIESLDEAGHALRTAAIEAVRTQLLAIVGAAKDR
jgi:hypothetical protein